MGLYLGHESALRYWLTKRGDECLPGCSPDSTLAHATANRSDTISSPLPFDYSDDRPLHLLVPANGGRRRTPGVREHQLSPMLPRGSFRTLAGAVRVASPELTYLLMAQCRGIQELAVIGCYLCGGFSVSAEGSGYTGARDPITTPEEIAAFLALIPGARGIKRARRALQYVVPNTASPIETLLALTSSLPPMLGGRTMPQVAANQRILVPERLQKLISADELYGDLYFESVRGDIEYDSYDFHTGRYRLDHTSTRRNVIEAAGIKVVSATWGQIKTFGLYQDFWWLVENNFGIRHKTYNEKQLLAQETLNYMLTNPEFRLF